MQSLNMEVGSSCASGDSSSSSVVQVCFPSAQAAVLSSLNRQREDGRLCDLSIHVQGQVFKAHRCVLAASSPYFHDQVGILILVLRACFVFFKGSRQVMLQVFRDHPSIHPSKKVHFHAAKKLLTLFFDQIVKWPGKLESLKPACQPT